MLEKIINDLKALLAESDLPGVFSLLRGVLNPDCRCAGEANMHSARYQSAKKEYDGGRIAFSDYQQELSKIIAPLLELILNIRLEDLNEHNRNKTGFNLEEFHAFTCDRNEQKNEFINLYYKQPVARIRHFYLYGDTRQEMQSLFYRLGYEMIGKSTNWRKAVPEPKSKVRFLDIKPDDTGSLLAFQLNIVKELLDTGYQQDLLQKNVTDLLSRYKELGAGDYLFILITIDDYNWDAELIPDAVRWLINEFCGVPVPDNIPQLFFFFGIEYEQDNKDIPDEIDKILETKSSSLEILPRLDKVVWKFVEKWFKDFELLVPEGMSHREYALQKFGREGDLDMYNIEIVLKDLIEKYRLTQLNS